MKVGEVKAIGGERWELQGTDKEEQMEDYIGKYSP
jgi:hypothetical protein